MKDVKAVTVDEWKMFRQSQLMNERRSGSHSWWMKVDVRNTIVTDTTAMTLYGNVPKRAFFRLTHSSFEEFFLILAWGKSHNTISDHEGGNFTYNRERLMGNPEQNLTWRNDFYKTLTLTTTTSYSKGKCTTCSIPVLEVRCAAKLTRNMAIFSKLSTTTTGPCSLLFIDCPTKSYPYSPSLLPLQSPLQHHLAPHFSCLHQNNKVMH